MPLTLRIVDENGFDPTESQAREAITATGNRASTQPRVFLKLDLPGKVDDGTLDAEMSRVLQILKAQGLNAIQALEGK